MGQQVCSDHVKTMLAAMPRYRMSVADRQLACAPVRSREGTAYLGAMAAAANYGRANRQLLAEEAPFAYKDVDEVVTVCERAGLARRVARLIPLGVVKG